MILVSDYDRTLKIDDEISLYNRKMIQEFEAAGHVFVVNSGRSYHHLKENFHLQNYSSTYTITGSGSQCHNDKDELIFSYFFDNVDATDLVGSIVKTNAISYQIATQNKWVYARTMMNNWSTLHLEVDMHAVNTVSAKFKSLHEAEKFCKSINKNFKVSAYQNGFNVDIAPYKISKATGIEELANHLGIQNEEVYCIGDSLNDLEMILRYDGFCVADSHDAIVQASSKVFESVGTCINYLLHEI